MPYYRPVVRPISILDSLEDVEPTAYNAPTYEVVESRNVDTLATEQRVTAEMAADSIVTDHVRERNMRTIGEELIKAVANRGPAIIGAVRTQQRDVPDLLMVSHQMRVNVFFLDGANEADWQRWTEVER